MSALYSPNAGLTQRVLPFHILSVGRFNSFWAVAAYSVEADFTSAGWPANNQAIYVPIAMPARFTIARFLVANGAVASGTFDIGIFNNAGVKLHSTGSTSQVGTSQVQYVGVTDQSFPPGNYFLGIVLSVTTGRVSFSNLGGTPDGEMCGSLLEVLGSAVLPTTMTPSARVRADYPCFGFSQSDTL